MHFRWTVLLAAAAFLPGQDDLGAAVEGFLGEREDAAAARRLQEILARPGLTGDAVAAALRDVKLPSASEVQALVPWRDQHLAASIRIPAGIDRESPRLPAVFDIAEGRVAPHLGLAGAVVVSIPGYTPPEFSDEGRDGFLKALRWAAHLGHGDPDRLWLCGFSWAGHASYDTALHRPDQLRGIIPLGGGPRRTHFRLLPNLRGTEVFSGCGGKDDAELVWNLEEVARMAAGLKLAVRVTIDPARGHELPLKGMDEAAAQVMALPARAAKLPASGTILADGPLVESPLLRIDEVDPARVVVPPRVPVSASLSKDGQRRATVKAMEKAVVRLRWKVEDTAGGRVVTLDPDGVRAATLFLRAPWFEPGSKVLVKARGKTVYDAVLAADPASLLADARRTGERLRPALATIKLAF